MIARLCRPLAALVFVAAFGPIARGDAAPSATQVVERLLRADPWGLSGGELRAVATVQTAGGDTRQIRFTARSLRYDGDLSESLVRVIAPADLAGVGFLQIQTRDADDERYLFLPELKRARRIAGRARDGSFVGTDFAYGDLDQRDLRHAAAKFLEGNSLGRYATYHLELKPTEPDALYARIETWVRQDNFVPLRSQMYAHSGALLKTLTSQEMRRISGRWFITRSVMSNEAQHRKTELVLEQVSPTARVSPQEFTVPMLERL